MKLIYKNGNVEIWEVRAVLDLEWDMLIAFPECTYVCASGIHWNKRRPERAAKTEVAIEFWNMLWNAPIKKKAFENPKGILSTRFRKPNQIIQPYQFGDDASKETHLWLEDLPPLSLIPELRFPGRWVLDRGRVVERWGNQTDSGQNKLAPSENRAEDRSRTWPGIAAAMARDWG